MAAVPAALPTWARQPTMPQMGAAVLKQQIRQLEGKLAHEERVKQDSKLGGELRVWVGGWVSGCAPHEVVRWGGQSGAW